MYLPIPCDDNIVSTFKTLHIIVYIISSRVATIVIFQAFKLCFMLMVMSCRCAHGLNTLCRHSHSSKKCVAFFEMREVFTPVVMMIVDVVNGWVQVCTEEETETDMGGTPHKIYGICYYEPRCVSSYTSTCPLLHTMYSTRGGLTWRSHAYCVGIGGGASLY